MRTWYFILFSNFITENQSAILSCIIDGNPKPFIIWFKDDKEIVDSDDFIHLEEPNGCYKLVIRNPLLFDSGTYKILAVNKYGQAISTCKLIVNEGIF